MYVFCGFGMLFVAFVAGLGLAVCVAFEQGYCLQVIMGLDFAVFVCELVGLFLIRY